MRELNARNRLGHFTFALSLSLQQWQSIINPHNLNPRLRPKPIVDPSCITPVEVRIVSL